MRPTTTRKLIAVALTTVASLSLALATEPIDEREKDPGVQGTECECPEDPKAAVQDDGALTWVFDPLALFAGGLGYNSNPFLLDEDLSGSMGSPEMLGVLDLDIRLVRDHDPDDRTRIMNAGFGYGIHGANPTDLPEVRSLDSIVRLYADGDAWLFEPKQKGGRFGSVGGRSLSFGGQYELHSTNIGGDPFRSSERWTFAGMFAWASTDSGCELNNLTFYLNHEDYDHRRAGVDPEFDRTGEYQSVRVEVNLFQTQEWDPDGQQWISLKYGCIRRGPFRRMLPETYRTYRVGYAYEDRDTDGLEFDASSNRFFANGQWPILRKRKDANDAVWSLQARLDVADSRYSNPSQFDPQVKREDRFIAGEFGARWHRRDWIGGRGILHFLDVLFGAGVEHQSSDIPLYEYDRWYVTAGVHVGFGRTLEGILPQGSGTSTTVSSGGSGEGDPVIVTNP